MANVKQTDYGTWECRWSGKDPKTGRRKFFKQRFRTKALADAKRREVETSAANGLSVDHRDGKKTVKHWANRWHEEHALTHAANTTATARVVLNASVLPLLGEMPIRNVTLATVSEFVGEVAQRPGRRNQPLSPATIKRHYQVLSNVLQYAAQHRAIPANPAVGIRLPTNKSQQRLAHRHLYLNTEQVQLLAATMDHPYNLLVRFLAATGLRVGECAGLNIADVDTQARVVYVHRTRQAVKGGWAEGTPKSGKRRTVPLARGLAADLDMYLAVHPRGADPDAPLWPGRALVHDPKGNRAVLDYTKPWSPAVFYKSVFKPAVRATEGIPDALRQHDLRHTFASICASRGIPAAQVADWMGHGNEVVTRTIYTHLFDEDTSRYTDALDAAFATGGGGLRVVAG